MIAGMVAKTTQMWPALLRASVTSSACAASSSRMATFTQNPAPA